MKDSLYTVSYAAVTGTVAALLLAGVWKFTTPYREANERMEVVRNVMKVLEVPHDPNMPAEDLIALFENKVERREDAAFIYYLYAPEDYGAGEQRLAVQFSGSGMWGVVEGFLAFEPDLKTIAGLSIYKQEETPGLGAEIAADWFLEQFRGLSIKDADGNLGIRIVRQRKAEKNHEVDAISGATMSGESLEKMLNKAITTIAREQL